MKKMNFQLVTTVILLLISQLSGAQESAGTWQCSNSKRSAAKATVADAAEDNYDVKYVKFNLALTNTSTYISADVATTARVIAPSFTTYVFELDSALVIDSVIINGVHRPVTNTGDLHAVSLSSALSVGAMFTAHVYYHGTPAGAGSTFSGVVGFNNMVSPSWGTRITFSHGESYHAREWWPCKQSLRDKIDSVDMWVTVPDSMKAGSNGLLKAVTTIDANHVRYEWKERHPIDYYLISVAVAPYIDYSYYMHFSGSLDSMLVQNYIYPNPGTLPRFKSVIDSTGMMIDYFSKLYSRYPFWDEKYGHCMAPLNGGMENQTMTTIGYFDAWVVAHELGHQWFGDNVTCGTWSDIFVNEGVASYTEDLFYEHFHSKAAMVSDMQSKQANVRKFDTGSIYVIDTADEGRIFDSRFSYHKGACMLHMLRFVIGDDSTFFHVLKTYQQEHKGGNGTILDLRDAAKSVLGNTTKGIVLDTFFRQWAYGEGFPVYAAKWNQSGNDVYVQLDQVTTAPASVSFFTMPVEIQLHSSAGDTIIRVNNYNPGELFQFKWSKTMTSVVIDPGHWLLDSVSSVIHDVKLSVAQRTQHAIRIYPNPASTGWNIDNLPLDCTLTLTDITGRTQWEALVSATSYTIPANSIPAGLYILRIASNDGVNQVYKLIKE